MNVTAAINVPNVDQTSIWKGCFEDHLLSGKEIDDKYPILNTKWKYSYAKYPTDNNNNIIYDGYYYAYEKDIGTGIMIDPWFREFKSHIAVIDSHYGFKHFMGYHTTVEGNPVLLKIYKIN